MPETDIYSHCQQGHVVKWVVTIAAAISALVIYSLAPQATLMALAAILLAMAVSFLFGSMTVEVQNGTLAWWFGPGFWKKSAPVMDIASAKPVRNSWWWGWGIRYYGKGWLYNVSGFDAVEVTLIDGKQFRLGTDDLEGLIQAINLAIGDKSQAPR